MHVPVKRKHGPQRPRDTSEMSAGTTATPPRGPWRLWRLWRRARAKARRLWNPTRAGHFLLFTLRRFNGDDGPRMAAALSYASLLALVPLLAIMLSIISAFPAFQGLEQRLLTLLLSDTLPPMDTDVAGSLHGFIKNATKLTGPGIVGLALTAVLLLANINDAFNTIWRVQDVRPLPVRLLVYWALLTLGPLLGAASLSMTSLLFAELEGQGLAAVATWLVPPWLVSILLGAVGFGLIFLVVPNRRMQPLHALAGGLTSAVLFEVLKYAFGLYLAHIPGYQAVYGAMAAVPLFLIWLYLSWSTVLLGAELSAALPEWGPHLRRAGAPWAGERLALALALLLRVRHAQQAGRALTRRALVQGLPATPGEIDAVLQPLRRHGLLARTGQAEWLLACDTTVFTLDDLLDALDLAPEPGEGWPPPVTQLVRAWASDSAGRRRTPLARLLDAVEETAPNSVKIARR